jgi:hypothetical protein
MMITGSTHELSVTCESPDPPLFNSKVFATAKSGAVLLKAVFITVEPPYDANSCKSFVKLPFMMFSESSWVFSLYSGRILLTVDERYLTV